MVEDLLCLKNQEKNVELLHKNRLDTIMSTMAV